MLGAAKEAVMTIYRGYDQAGLDAQYNLRAAVPEHPRYFARWAADSAAVRTRLAGHLDLAYGPGARQRLDIFPAPARASAAGGAALVFIHGGYWQALEKASFSYPAPVFHGAGITYVAIGYPLAPAADMDAIVDSIRAALVWLWRNGAEYGIDPDDIHVAGHSAGGHLAVTALTTDWPARAPELPADLVKSATAISGVYDLEPIRLCYLNQALSLDAESARRHSPAAHVPDAAGPLFLAVGAAETDEYRRQQADFLAGWRAHGLIGVGVELPGLDHFAIADGLADPESPLSKGIVAMISADGAAD